MMNSASKWRWWPRLPIAAVVLLATVLTLVGAPAMAAPAGPASVPAAAAPAAACTSGAVLFRDDFSNPASGWPTGSDANGRGGYAAGEYFVEKFPSQFGWFVVAYPTQYRDFCAEVDARLESPTMQAYVLLWFRGQQGTTDGYRLAVVPDLRQYAVVRGGGGAQTVLANLTDSTAINPGTAMNRLGAQARGAQIVLYINGVAVQTVTDAMFQGGQVGIAVGHLQNGAAAAHFDNLEVRS